MKNDTETVIYTLPISKDPNIFGPEYWKAIHDLANKIPCEHCRNEAKSFMTFFHDLKNYELDKEIFDKENFIVWLRKINLLNKKKLTLK